MTMKNILIASLSIFILLTNQEVVHCAPMEIYVSIPPQKWLSDEIGGSLVTTHVLIDQGQEPHTFDPTPKLRLPPYLNHELTNYKWNLLFLFTATDKSNRHAC